MQSASQPSQPQRKGQEQPEEQKPVNIFANFHLRRIVKENHGQPIYRCCYNKYPSMMSGIAFLEEIDTSNIYATLSEQQVNFYDNEHCGDHLDIISQFTVKPKPGRSPKSPFKLVTCTWVRREFETVLAVGDSDGCIRLLSLAMSKETDCIDTNSDVTTTPISIVELHAHPIDSELLFSLMSDSTVQLWHLSARRCLCIFKTNATVMDVHSKGYAFVTGAADGSLAEWTIPSSVHALDKKAATKFTPIQSEDHKVHEVSLDAGTGKCATVAVDAVGGEPNTLRLQLDGQK
ncbi:uncharacterized protein BJ171DRAFT_213253 [Polychytrium aggregatum]|uniref:uncharacterized protein n=1 Tax=Polychytrium aggregatum TaxID=110093 RepID=UPI0022FDFB6C|nr:uncharacterized protein BJ171DRAFT_213253 [Polychytrium aggregatum]KAI9208775.1 hypothetical protein BJ171DRAFT_213253 [Polychytrium aggregatum]